MKISTNEKSSWYRWLSTQLPIRIRITLGWTRAEGARVKCKNYLTMVGTGKRSQAARCSRVKNTSLCSPPSTDSSALSFNRRSMLSGTSQYVFNSSIVRDAMKLLVEGVVRGRPLRRPLMEVSSRPLAILLADQKERRKRILDPRQEHTPSPSNSFLGGISIKTRPFFSRILTAGDPSPTKDKHY